MIRKAHNQSSEEEAEEGRAILSSSLLLKLVPSISVRIRSSLYRELRHWFTAELASYLRTERLLIWIVEDRKMTESSLDLQESGWEELRREARKIEGDLDVKLSSYAKLGARFTQGGSFFFLSAWSCSLCVSFFFSMAWYVAVLNVGLVVRNVIRIEESILDVISSLDWILIDTVSQSLLWFLNA